MSQTAADKDRVQRAEALIARMKKARGYMYRSGVGHLRYVIT